MDSLELLIEIETYFQIEITNIEAEIIETVGDFQQCVLEKLATKKSSNANMPYYKAPEIFEIIKKIIHQKLGAPLGQITINAKIGKDLGID